MRALHSFGRLTERRSLPTQLSSRRYSAVGGFNAPARIAFRQNQESPGEPVMNYHQSPLTTSIAVFVVRRVACQ
jgi:hypothetical protein